MNYDKKPKVVKLNFEFDEANLSIEDKIILDYLSLVTHVAEAWILNTFFLNSTSSYVRVHHSVPIWF